MNYKIGKSINKNFYYGWAIILVSAISYFFASPGQTFFISTFIDAYIDEFNYSRTEISSYYSIATIMSGSLLVLMGRAVDQQGQRKMLIIAGIMLAMACMISSSITTIPFIILSFFLLRFFGQGSLTLIPGTLVPQWFNKRRAFAISLASMGGIAANLLTPIINTALIAQIGWRMTWVVWAILLVIIFIPIMYFFVINKPEDIDLNPDNQKAQSQEETEMNALILERESWSLSQAIRTKDFWMISLISMINPLIATGLTFHFIDIMATKGITNRDIASFILGFMAIPGFLMPILAGILIDKVKPKLIILFTILIIIFDLIFMLSVDNRITAILFVILFSLMVNIQKTTLNVTYVNYFGRKYLGSIRGLATVFMVLGTSVGALPFGWSYDQTGSYNIAIIGSIALSIIGLILALFIAKPVKKDVREEVR
jgi:sugar phosphate permease